MKSVVEIVDQKEDRRLDEEVVVEDDEGEVNRIGNVTVVSLEVLIGLKVKSLGNVILLVPGEVVVNNDNVDWAVVDGTTVDGALVCVEVSVVILKDEIPRKKDNFPFFLLSMAIISTNFHWRLVISHLVLFSKWMSK